MIITGTTDILTKLEDFVSGSTNSDIVYISQKTIQYTDAFASNTITRTEFNDLIADLKIDQIVVKTSKDSEIKSEIIDIVNNLITIISSVAPSISIP